MHDPDAIGGKDFLHWSVWNFAPDTTQIAEDSLPEGARQGNNDYPTIAYGPACPPPNTGRHRYTFDLYALDRLILLPEGSDRATLESATKGHILATAQLIGIVDS
jgi:Raf kinase inhibitor-like YbhB/YbcL family protein